MLTRLHQTRSQIRQFADGGLFAASLLIAYFLRANFPWLELDPLEPLENYLWFLPFAAVLGPLILRANGFYEPPAPLTRLGTFFVILRGCTLTVASLILLLFIARYQLARSVIILVGAIGGLLVYARDEVTTRLDRRVFSQRQIRRRVLWVGNAAENKRIREALSGAERATLEDSGFFDPAIDPPEALLELLHKNSISVVVLNLAGIDRGAVDRVLQACSREGIEVIIRPGIVSLPSPRVTVDQFGGEAVFFFRAQAASPAALALKQLIDYVAGAILLLLLSPLVALVAAVIRITSAGPVVFRQKRAGLNGRPFTMLKFRTMTADADKHQAELTARNEMRGPVFKVSDDPRITPLGRFLRRHSLDELPQLWNVLRGEMSLVGPRPLPVEEVGRFDDDAHRRRLSVKPGLTCLWQVSGRSDIADFTDWVRLDLAYIDNWSLWLDLKILLATVPAAIFGRGAK